MVEKNWLKKNKKNKKLFGKYDLDNDMRMVFYPAVIGWVLLSLWILDVKKRLAILTHKKNEE